MWALRDKTCVITGANAGIGRATALGLARKRARIVMICRDRGRAAKVQAEIRKAGSPEVTVLLADLSIQADVRRVAGELLQRCPAIDVLVNNVGVVMPKRTVSHDGREMTLAINHLAPFLLTNLLLDRLKSSAPSRIVVVASQVEKNGRIDFDDLDSKRGYEPLIAYCQAKLANVLFTYELARRLADTEVTVNCLHPGVIATNLLCDYMGRPRAMGRLNRIKYPGPKEGAATSIRLASDPALSGISGKYFRPEGEANSSKQSYDVETSTRLWEVSERLTGLSESSP